MTWKNDRAAASAWTHPRLLQHDLDHSASGEESYKMQLQNITTRLIATGAKLQYALTTPFMPLTTTGNFVVDELNAIASDIMAAHNIPIVDLHTLVTDHCGTVSLLWMHIHRTSLHRTPTLFATPPPHRSTRTATGAACTRAATTTTALARRPRASLWPKPSASGSSRRSELELEASCSVSTNTSA